MALGSEDTSVGFYDSPKFTCAKSVRDHSGFVNCVRYSPDGQFLVSVSSDKSIIQYDANTSELV
jgi:WD40 repeat protein